MAVRTGVLKAVLGTMAVCLIGYVVIPPLYWHLKEDLAAVIHSSYDSCPPCHCDCDFQPLTSLSQGLNNASFSDCAKHDSDVSDETQKNFAELLSEELKTRETEALENQQRADMALLEAKKMTSQYQKEADKCNSGMETCEEAREKAEEALLAQKQLTATWELRARQKGWSESQSQGNTQAF